MPNPKNAAAYPQEFWAIAERYEKAPGEYQLLRLSFSDAVRWRHKFYTFRVALKAEGGQYRFKDLFNAQLVLRDDEGQPVNMKNYKVGKWKTPNALMEGATHEWGNGPWTTIWIRPATDAGSNSEMLQAALAQMEANAQANPRPVQSVELPLDHIRSTPEPTPEQMGLTPEEAMAARGKREEKLSRGAISNQAQRASAQLASALRPHQAQTAYNEVFKKMFDKPSAPNTPSAPMPQQDEILNAMLRNGDKLAAEARRTAPAQPTDPERDTLEITETGTAVLSLEELMKREMLEDDEAGDNNAPLPSPT